MSVRHEPLPLSFRTELISSVMPALQAGECCSIIGTSGVGKSNLARFLRRRDVQANYWKSDSSWIILIDTNGLVLDDQQPSYLIAELMLHRILIEAESRLMATDLLVWISQLHRDLIAQPSAHLALRYLERVCARLCESNEIQLIFVFDQFEDIWSTVNARFFLNLRNLRDQFKYQIAYLVITRQRLQRLRDDLKTVEAFWELFGAHVYGLGMYSERDAQNMIDRLSQRRNISFDSALRAPMLWISGRHPGLLRAVFWTICDDSQPSLNPTTLIDTAAIADECAKIWDDCTEQERQILRVVQQGLTLRPASMEILADLRLKELVIDEQSTLFSPLFSVFVRRQPASDMSGVVIDSLRRKVWLDGQPVMVELSALEFKLLIYLAERAGKVCERDGIMNELYGELAYDSTDDRLSTLLSRLRETLDEDARNPRYLFTHRGVGIRLSKGRIQS